MLRAAARHRRFLCSDSSGVIASAWPRGLLQESGGKRPTTISLTLAEELLYEVGWQSRHASLDVRDAGEFSLGRMRGAISVPFEPQGSFLARADAAIERMRLELPAAQHLALASQPRTGTASGDELSPKLSKLIVAGDDSSSLALTATSELLAAGYQNVVALEAGYGTWASRGLPCEHVLGAAEDMPDSTF